MTCLSKCLKEALRNSWSKETAHDSHDEAAGDKSPIGQCDVTALMIQETMGGEIIRCDIRNPHSRDAFVHYYNKNDGEIIDATAEGIDPKYIPEAVFNASEEELQKVKGIGKELAAKIKNVLETKFKTDR